MTRFTRDCHVKCTLSMLLIERENSREMPRYGEIKIGKEGNEKLMIDRIDIERIYPISRIKIN